MLSPRAQEVGTQFLDCLHAATSASLSSAHIKTALHPPRNLLGTPLRIELLSEDLKMAPQDSFPLHGTNVRLPSRGIGTFQPNPEDYPEGSVTASVIYALKIGYRHIDAAFAYGRGSVERDVGEALRKSGVPREEIFITTKL